MPEQFLYEYALIRVVPRVEREEFINIGVIVFCAKQKFLQTRYVIDQERLQALFPGLNVSELDAHVAALAKICAGGKSAGPIAQLDLPSRFRWLTATRSTIVQASKVHPGFSTDLEHTVTKIFNTMVR